jgi:hypothetical protein
MYDRYAQVYLTPRDIALSLDIQCRAKFFPKELKEVLEIENPNSFERWVAKLVTDRKEK